MKKRERFIFSSNRIKKENNTKLYLSLLLIVISISSIVFYEVFSYKILIRDFVLYFDQNNFSKANNLIITNQNFNPLKSLFLEKDLTTYFSQKITSVNDKFNAGELSESDAENIITEISKYNIIIDDSSRLVNNFITNNTYENALNLYKKGDFIAAYKSFLDIKQDDTNYSKSIDYLAKSKQKIKEDILTKSSELSSKHYYTKALELIATVDDIIGEDNDVKNTISEINKNKESYLATINKETQTASSSIINNISTGTINNLSLESLTPYLVYVNLNEQKTFIYKGGMNKWELTKTMTCSTGINSEATPQGVYTVKEKGDWFYSEKYQQGGKYWVQFMGDYLFHSVPYAKDKTTVLDSNLGVKSSHGCIRLSLDDSKWLYDNLKAGTKIIIK